MELAADLLRAMLGISGASEVVFLSRDLGFRVLGLRGVGFGLIASL